MHAILYWAIQGTIIAGSFLLGRMYEKGKQHQQYQKMINRRLG